MSPSVVAAKIQNPFPGLPAFQTEQAHLFHGRREQVSGLLHRMAKSRLLAVVGTSGIGKSSLVRAGLLPALYRGYLGTAGTHWRIAVMRPGSMPLLAMAQALGSPDALGMPGETWNQMAAVETLVRSSLGLADLARERQVGDHDNLLLVVDQFEEIFRFRRERLLIDGGEEAKGFVTLLLAAAEQTEVPVYVVLTMRSDFLGDCAQFPSLPEALNQNQYLVPRMTRAQRRQSIEGPLEMAGVPITQRLVQRILSDAGDAAPESLPVLQHALMRTFEAWRADPDGAVDIGHYERAGRIEGALHQHAEELWSSLSTEQRPWAARLFRCLTTSESGRAVRRPTPLERIFPIVGASTETELALVKSVLETFAAPACSFLTVDSAEEIRAPSVIDISHESLIAHWKRLDEWVKEESESADWYKRLVRAAELHVRGQARLWSDPDLHWAWTRRNTDAWNPDWADQYASGYPQAIAFLEASKRAQEAEEQAQKERRELDLRNARQRVEAERRAKRNYLVLAVALAGLSAVAVFLAIHARDDEIRAEALAVQSDILSNRATAAERTAQAALKEKEAASARGAEAEQLREQAAKARQQADASAKMAATLEQSQSSLSDRTSQIIEDKNRQIAFLRAQLSLAQQSLSPPVARLTADPVAIEHGTPAFIRWQVTGQSAGDVTSVSIDQTIGRVPNSGYRRVYPSTSTTYTLRAAGPGGTATASATVTVSPSVPITTPLAGPEVAVLSAWQAYLLRGRGFNSRAMIFVPAIPTADDARAVFCVIAERPGGEPLPLRLQNGAALQDTLLRAVASRLAQKGSAKKGDITSKYQVVSFPLTIKNRVVQPEPGGMSFEFNSVKYEIRVTGKNRTGKSADDAITVVLYPAPARP
jgi:hypothetical protein